MNTVDRLLVFDKVMVDPATPGEDDTTSFDLPVKTADYIVLQFRQDAEYDPGIDDLQSVTAQVFGKISEMEDYYALADAATVTTGAIMKVNIAGYDDVRIVATFEFIDPETTTVKSKITCICRTVA